VLVLLLLLLLVLLLLLLLLLLLVLVRLVVEGILYRNRNRICLTFYRFFFNTFNIA
jgi:hypothetical protein